MAAVGGPLLGGDFGICMGGWLLGLMCLPPCCPCRFALPIKNQAPGFIDWLYLSKDVRITQGSKGSLFVHTRAEALE